MNQSITLGELKQMIEDAESEGATDETEVRLAHQPNYPLELSVARLSLYVPETDDPSIKADPPVIYLVEDSQLGYLPGDVCSQLGWGR